MAEGGRATAQKVRLADVAAGNLDSEETRINVMGVVVGVNNEQPPSFMLDDQSALMLVRQFDKNPTPPVGSCVCVIGRARQYGNERYVTSEIVKVIDVAWLQVRSLELARKSSFVTPTVSGQSNQNAAVEDVVEDQADGDATVLQLIRKLDTGQGAAMDDVIAQAGENPENTIASMLKRGDIFEISPGRIKILE